MSSWMNFSRATHLFGEALLRFVYPASCGNCSSLLEIHEQFLCQTCRFEFEKLRFSPDRFASEDAHPGLDDAWSLYPYEGIVRDLIGHIKFSRKRWLLKLFIRDFCEMARSLAAFHTYDIILPVPMDRIKWVDRQYHLVTLLAGELSKTLRVPCIKTILVKSRRTYPQSQLHREERAVNLTGAFKIRSPSLVQGKTILIVDDVLTTGATAKEAAKTLKLHGAKQIDLVTLARTDLTR